ncbi:hypothetical protein KFU94_10650 [Chloroflexi bacterium TSY]|nr:hypothetical protein [Chloroflexi bacterium TSY]
MLNAIAIPFSPSALSAFAVVQEDDVAEPLACLVNVTPLFFEESIHGVEGGAGRLEIAIEVDPQDEPRVAFFESEVTGAGPMWRASGWSAITFASLLLALDPSTYRISFDFTFW